MNIETTNTRTNMNRISIVGSGGAGKSTLSRELRDILHLPLFHLDNLFWRADKSHIDREEFDEKLNDIINQDKWIIDGDYSRTYEIRIEKSDTIIFLDYPLDVCLEGVKNRIGKVREDMPWKEDIFDPEFKEWIIAWHENKRPVLMELLEKYKDNRNIYIFKSREETNIFLESLKER